MSLLSLTGKLWKIHRPEPQDHGIVDLLRKERGIADDPAGKLFDPFLFPEMQKAVDRIEHAMKKKETIAIFGDYDADGITATAQLVRFFERHGITPLVHLPDRVKEGYGMRKESIDLLREKGVSLIITVDTGISAHDEIAHAKSLSIDVIVTDHHRPSPRGDGAMAGKSLPYAVIHPLVPSPIPNPHLCGAGVAFMLVRALEHGKPWNGIEIDIALASIGTIGDLVPLVGENRLLVRHGLKCLENLPPCPLKDFVDSVRGNTKMSSTDVAFKIVPRLNAAGRMAHPTIALDALLKGGEALEQLHRLNSERQTFVDALDEEIGVLVDSKHSFIVLAHKNITPGTAGLLASRFTERFSRPSLIAAVLDEKAVASIRSIPEVDAMECLGHPSVSMLLTSFGGHSQAAGCTFEPRHVGALQEALNAVLIARGFNIETMKPTLEIDAVLHPSSVTLACAETIESLSPFGQGNDEPVFLLSAQTLSDFRLVGTEGSHLQLRVGGVKAIGFRLGNLLEHLHVDQRYDIACRVGVNAWNGKETVQLIIEDIRKT
ncbi:single-stranded-DNA-specific exonuclease RecJ [Candidatus Peribacteria bacterium]|nr:single-stranded-DNA-specific exonuclease RecJ [Candidatus Peribacteria bacterium]